MIELERENFRVDSEGWKPTIWRTCSYITCLENPNKDIWEYVGGVDERLVGQQLFTWRAAMRETKKAGKRIPTFKQWSVFIRNQADIASLLELFTGRLQWNPKLFQLIGQAFFYWSCSRPTQHQTNLGLYKNVDYDYDEIWALCILPPYISHIRVNPCYEFTLVNCNRRFGLSVRCLNLKN